MLRYKNYSREIYGGFNLTTNNRMELMACIAGFEALKERCFVTLTSDSKYVVDAINKGWAERWRRDNWKRNRHEMAVNTDLWERLLNLIERHKVVFEWVKGHAGHPENERCDELATLGAKLLDKPEDPGYLPSRH